MKGIICLWSGLLADIPNGWALCDGTNGTPDMRGRFPISYWGAVEPGGSGGNANHFHTTTGDVDNTLSSHQHTVDITSLGPNSNNNDVSDIAGGVEAYDIHTHDLYGYSEPGGAMHDHSMHLSSNVQSNVPPYKIVAFIMKL